MAKDNYGDIFWAYKTVLTSKYIMLSSESVRSSALNFQQNQLVKKSCAVIDSVDVTI